MFNVISFAKPHNYIKVVRVLFRPLRVMHLYGAPNWQKNKSPAAADPKFRRTSLNNEPARACVIVGGRCQVNGLLACSLVVRNDRLLEQRRFVRVIYRFNLERARNKTLITPSRLCDDAKCLLHLLIAWSLNVRPQVIIGHHTWWAQHRGLPSTSCLYEVSQENSKNKLTNFFVRVVAVAAQSRPTVSLCITYQRESELATLKAQGERSH